MRVDGVADVGDLAAHLDGQRDFRDQVAGMHADDAAADHAVRGFVEHQLGETLGATDADGAPAGSPRELADADLQALLLRLALGDTDPEIAWVGVTETEAREKGLKVGVGKFPWAASGRAIGLGRTEGFTKLVFDEASHRVIGGGIVGPHAGELIAEVALAIEMGAEAADIGHTIHPHPTLSESVAMAAEVYEGTITDLYIPKKG